MGRDSGKDDGIWHVGAAYNFNNDLTLSGMYLNSNWDGERNSDDDGWTVGLNYKGAQASDAGSYGIFARYYDQGEGLIGNILPMPILSGIQALKLCSRRKLRCC